MIDQKFTEKVTSKYIKHALPWLSIFLNKFNFFLPPENYVFVISPFIFKKKIVTFNNSFNSILVNRSNSLFFPSSMILPSKRENINSFLSIKSINSKSFSSTVVNVSNKIIHSGNISKEYRLVKEISRYSIFMKVLERTVDNLPCNSVLHRLNSVIACDILQIKYVGNFASLRAYFLRETL